MEPSRLKSIVQTGYDRLATKYADTFWAELQRKPFDRDLLTQFASRLPPASRIADIGCGPCQIGRFLADHGLRVLGVDVSLAMLLRARALNPDCQFACQDIRALALRSGSLGGLVAFYSLIHLLEAEMDQGFSELRRVLAPGGIALFAMHAGDGNLYVESMLGEAVPMYATLFNLVDLRSGLERAGFAIVEALSRPPYEFEYQSTRLYVTAKRVE